MPNSLLQPHIRRISPDEYLDGEPLAAIRHEYAAGHVTAMAGASEMHEVLAGDLFGQFWTALRGKKCRVFKGDMKLRLTRDPMQFFYYPDLMIVCDPKDKESPYFKDRPTVIVEVVSPSSEATDTETKFFAYTSIPSLQSYVIIFQTERKIIVHRRSVEGITGWSAQTLTQPDEWLELPEIEFRISVGIIYENVEMGAMA
jgi:Uma2 family endonuclease